MYFIFEVHLKTGYQPEQYAAAWVKASELIQQAEGARGTRLHRKIGDDTKLLAVASWESKIQRDAMEGAQSAEIEAIIKAEAEFVDVQVIGEFEDAEWRVTPPNASEPY